MRPVVAAVVLLSACGGAQAASPAPAPAPTPPAPPARFHYQPATTKYQAVIHRHVVQTFNGQDVVTDLSSLLLLTARIEQADSGLAVEFVLDSVAVDSAASQLYSAHDVAAAQHARYTGRLLSTGEITDLRGGDSTNPVLAQVLKDPSQFFPEFFPRLSVNGVGPEDAWTDTTSTHTDIGTVNLLIHATNTHHTGDWGAYAHERALPLTVVSNYTVTGSGEQAGQPVTLKGEGHRTQRAYLSAHGHYLGGIAADTSQYEIVLTKMGMTVPVSQWGLDSLTVLP